MRDIGAEARTAYLRRLSAHSVLSGAEERAVAALPGEPKTVQARRDLIRPGDHVSHAILVADGLLGRYDLMSDGARQITSFHIPGDLCDLHSVVAPATGWGVTALSAADIVEIPHGAIRKLVRDYPNLALVLWRDSTLDASILAKWVGNIGRRSAIARIAHLLCEMGIRMEAAGLGIRTSYQLLATQEQVGDAVGLTAVHVNRSIRLLRELGIASIARYRVEIKEWDKLSAVAEFSATFLLPYRVANLATDLAA